MALIVLRIDASDAGLIEHFDVHSFRLDGYFKMETFVNTKDDPYSSTETVRDLSTSNADQ